MSTTRTTAIAMVVLVCVLPQFAAAQDGPTPVDAAAQGAPTQQFRLNATWTGGYDDNAFADNVGALLSEINRGGSNTGGIVGLFYARHSGRVDFGAQGDSSFKIYKSAEHHLTTYQTGSTSAAFDLTKRIQARVSADGQYSPYYQLDQFTQLLEPGHFRVFYVVQPQRTLNAQATGSLTFQVARHSSFDVQYTRRRSIFYKSDLDLSTEYAGGRFTHAISKYASLYMGYRRDTGKYKRDFGQFQANKLLRGHAIDAGIETNRSIQVGPRTMIGFDVGAYGVEDGHHVLYQPTGRFAITRQLSKRWSTKAEYQRLASFVEGFQDLLFSDSVTLGLNVRLQRNAFIQWQGGYATGHIGQTIANSLSNYYGGGRFQSQISRTLTFFVESFYYAYRVNNAGIVNAEMLTHVNRTVAFAGVQLSLPLVAEREASATR